MIQEITKENKSEKKFGYENFNKNTKNCVA